MRLPAYIVGSLVGLPPALLTACLIRPMCAGCLLGVTAAPTRAALVENYYTNFINAAQQGGHGSRVPHRAFRRTNREPIQQPLASEALDPRASSASGLVAARSQRGGRSIR